MNASSSIGAPVELGAIERELKKLWAEGEGAMTRASLINLAVYSEEPGSLARNTELVARITDNNACRAIVIAAHPSSPENRAAAWINAHCHVSGSGGKQVCSEQISFELHGTKLLSSILFSHLDSDLPLYLWWQGELRAPIDPQLWAWVDRLIYDSRDWRDFNAQMQLAEAAQREGEQRQIVLCDLNWTRLTYFRLAFAQFFDDAASHRYFDEIKKVSIGFGRGYHSSALLFLGWIAAQLGWEATSAKDAIELTNSTGKPVRVELFEDGEAPVAAVAAETGEMEFRIHRAACGDLLKVSRVKKARECARQLLPADDGDLAALVSSELTRGGERRVYLRAVEKMRAFL